MDPHRRRRLIVFLRDCGLDPAPAAGGGQQTVSLAAIEEALSHTSAGLHQNHERLEFLGDAVLRLAAAEFLQHRHPRLRVGEWSALRAQLVSDRWLTELAERIQLEPLLHLGPKAAADRIGRATVLAECCEALIGGLYEAWGSAEGGLAAVQAFLAPHWQRTAAELLADPHRHNWKSALQEWSQSQGLGLPRYSCQERSKAHGDPRRFHCSVSLPTCPGPFTGPATGAIASEQLQSFEECVLGEGFGGSRRGAEQEAARAALAAIERSSL
jgi:ribonuclease-3